ncbi:MAG: murein biosynthesis integral membrane protein MurJ [Anaerolineae bacterium]
MPHETVQIARAASMISLGNIASRVLGLVREIVKSYFFGAGGAVDAFNVATSVPTMVSDLLAGGMVNSALVPVFSEYAHDRRDELWGLAAALLNLIAVLLIALIIIGELFAPQIAFVMSSGSSPAVLALTAFLLRITIPAVLFLNLAAVLSGLLYALKRFTLPAFMAAVFNASMVLVTLLYHGRMGIAAMAIGLLIGAVAQMLLLLPGLRDARLVFTPTLWHPGLRQIILLFLPIALGVSVDVLISRPISYTLASQTGEGGISWMNYATYLMQLPHGLVATAISFAILPTLSVHAAAMRRGGDSQPFRVTLARGMRLVIVLIIPAAVGLFILAKPVIALIYQHGDFTALDTRMTSLALQIYLLGLPFAALDLLLVFSFYALKDTLTPSLIGVAAIAVYLLTAVLLLPRLGLFSLMAADSIKHLLHMVTSAVLLARRVGGLRQHGLPRTLGVTLAASAVMGAAAAASLYLLAHLPGMPGGLAEVLAVVVPGVVGAAIYLGLMFWLRVEEIELLWGALRRRLAR